MRLLRSFVVRVIIAAAISILTWWTCSRAWGTLRELQSAICQVTDWPVAVVGRLLFPRGHEAIDMYYGRSLCDFCTDGELLWRHLKLAVPVYLVLSYLITGVVWLITHREKRGAS